MSYPQVQIVCRGLPGRTTTCLYIPIMQLVTLAQWVWQHFLCWFLSCSGLFGGDSLCATTRVSNHKLCPKLLTSQILDFHTTFSRGHVASDDTHLSTLPSGREDQWISPSSFFTLSSPGSFEDLAILLRHVNIREVGTYQFKPVFGWTLWACNWLGFVFIAGHAAGSKD